MRDLVEFLVRALVSEPESVRVEEIAEDDGTVFEVHVAEDDLGRVIGRDGRVANALRTIAKAAFATPGPSLVNVLTDPADAYPRSSNLA